MLRTRSSLAAVLCLLATGALAQRPPSPSPAPPPGQGQRPAGDRQIAPAADAAPTPRGRPSCEEVRRRAKYSIYFDKVDIDKLVQTVADATCKTFILTENVRGKISIIGPENGKVEVDADQFYAAFLSALDANGLTVSPHGRFLKIVDKRSAKQSTIPTILEGEPYTTNEQMVTKIFRVRYVEVEPLRGVLSQLVSKDGDCIPYAPDTLICNDIGSNMHRLEKIMGQLDTRSSVDEIRTVQIRFAAAADVASTIQKIFESRQGARPGQRPNAAVMPGQPGIVPPGGDSGGPPGGPGGGNSGPVTLNQLIPDERTNKLIIVASPAAFERIQRLIDEIDIPTSEGGKINVYYLENANAEDVAGTLQSLAQGSSNRPRQPNVPQPPQVPGQPRGVTTAELFAGEVKISADKATNSLVIVASQADYKNLVRVIEKLDIPRRQVFVEAVIMEVNLDRSSQFGVSMHQGLALNGSYGGQQVSLPILLGTKYNEQGLPPSIGLDALLSFSGFLAGLQGPVIPELAKLGFANVPAFGVVLHALQVSSDVNVLSTPHILTSDNEEAEITVGQNVPFQAGIAPGSLSALGATPTQGGINPALLTGGLGNFFAPINRQNVELKLTIKPQINESDFIRMVITEQTEEIFSQDRVLGPTTSKRSAKTTVVAKNQETVVIGGIMQDRVVESVRKIPVLGDLPILGHLFREQERKKIKTNLLLFLTPYIIQDQSDFRAIFERKMRERQQFVEQFYGQVPGYDTAVDFSRKSGPLGKLNQTVLHEERKVENGGPGLPGERMIQPGASQVPPAHDPPRTVPQDSSPPPPVDTSPEGEMERRMQPPPGDAPEVREPMEQPR
jgi:general secretion pathway protein D